MLSSGGSDLPLGFKQLHQLAQVSLLVFTQSKPSYLINILVKKGRKGHIVRPSNERETSSTSLTCECPVVEGLSFELSPFSGGGENLTV